MDPKQFEEELRQVVSGRVTFSGQHAPEDLHDESLTLREREPLAVVRPTSTEELSRLMRWLNEREIAVTARGSGTGLSGGATPVSGGVVVCFDEMRDVVSLNTQDHVVVVQAGITLRELNQYLAGSGLRYPVYPGELSGSLGGNVNTNAGGMRAVRHGVTRNHVLGLEMVLMDGTVLHTGGPITKISSGYDLTQLVIGSEGTLALVSEVTLKLSPILSESATLLVPFLNVESVADAVPALIASGIAPSILEYVDALTMAALEKGTDLQLGVDSEVAARCAAYLIVVLETRTREQLDSDLARAADIVTGAGALELYVLEGAKALQLIEARERAFWMAKAAGANEIVDIVVPRSMVPIFLVKAQDIARRHDSFMSGCGHVGDGNVHLSLYQPDFERRERLLRELFKAGVDMGGAVSGEHGLGLDKRRAYLELADPVLIELQRKIKAVFDPKLLLNPYRHIDARDEVL